MANFLFQLRQLSQSTLHLLLVYIILIMVFGLLSSHQPALWQNFLPILLMGLSYVIVTLSLDEIFREDVEDGTLEWLMSTNQSMEGYVGTKILVHWIRLGLPLAGIVGVVSGFSSFSLLWSAALLTLTLTLLGAMNSALCLTIKAQGALLPPLLTLPLGIPMMIASMAVTTAAQGTLFAYLSIQGGLLLIACAISFVVCPFALKLAMR